MSAWSTLGIAATGFAGALAASALGAWLTRRGIERRSKLDAYRDLIAQANSYVTHAAVYFDDVGPVGTIRAMARFITVIGLTQVPKVHWPSTEEAAAIGQSLPEFRSPDSYYRLLAEFGPLSRAAAAVGLTATSAGRAAGERLFSAALRCGDVAMKNRTSLEARAHTHDFERAREAFRAASAEMGAVARREARHTWPRRTP